MGPRPPRLEKSYPGTAGFGIRCDRADYPLSSPPPTTPKREVPNRQGSGTAAESTGKLNFGGGNSARGWRSTF